jgi:hypothetical protein
VADRGNLLNLGREGESGYNTESLIVM